MDVVDARRYSGPYSPDLKDPFRRCIKIIDPFTNQVKEVCGPRGFSAGGTSGQGASPVAMDARTMPTLGGSPKRTRTRRRRRMTSRKSRR